MTESIYKEYENKYYNPNDNDKKPGDNDNWKSIQEGFHRISSTQLETSAGLTLGKGTVNEVEIDGEMVYGLLNFVGKTFAMVVVSSATELDAMGDGVFLTPNDSDIVAFLRNLDPAINYSFIMTAFDNVKIPYALEITFIDPITEDESTVYNVLSAEIGRNITDAKIYFKSIDAEAISLSGYIVGILAVGANLS